MPQSPLAPEPGTAAVGQIVHPDFVAVADTFRQQLERTEGGAAVSVYHRGEPVIDMWGGSRTVCRGTP